MIALLKSLIIIVITFLLYAPFLPLKKADICFASYDYDKKERHRNLPFVLVSLVVSLLIFIFFAEINKAFNWIFSLPFMEKIISLLSGKFLYSAAVLKYVVLNIITIVPYLAIKASVKRYTDRYADKKKDSKNAKKKVSKTISKTAEQTDERRKKIAELRRNSELCFDASFENGKKDTVITAPVFHPEDEPQKKESKKKKEAPATFKEAFLYVYNKLKGVFYDENDEYATVKYSVLKWSKHLFWFLIIIGALFLLLVTLLLIPVFFDLNWENAYKTGSEIAEKLYLYPMIGFIVLRELCSFLSGEPKKVPPLFVMPFSVARSEEEIDLQGLETALISENKTSFARIMNADSEDNSTYNTENAPPQVIEIKEFIKKTHNAVNRDFLYGLDCMFSGDNVIFDTTMYSSLGLYIFCYMHAELSFGKRMLFICNDRDEKSDVKEYIKEGLKAVSGTEWRIEDPASLTKGKRIDILVMTVDEIDDGKVFSSGTVFFDELTDVFIFDAEKMISLHKYLCLIVTKRLEAAAQAGKDGKPSLKYRFFTTGNVANIKNTVIQLFDLGMNGAKVINSFRSAYSVQTYIWKTGSDSTLYLDRSASQLQLGTAIAQTAKRYNVEYINLMTGHTVYDSQTGTYEGILLNRCTAADNDLGYTVVCDDNFNFPSTLYHYLRFSGKKKTILHIISKPYLLREYFLENADEYTDKYDLFGKASNEHTEEDKTALIILVIDALNGIPVTEFCKRADKLADYIGLPERAGDTVYDDAAVGEYAEKCLQKLLGAGFRKEALHYKLTKNTGDDGSVDIIFNIIDKDGLFVSFLSDMSPVTVKFENTEENGTVPVQKRLISRYYLPSQTIAFKRNGKIGNYTVKNIDIANGIMLLDDTDATVNVPEEYVQKRVYTAKNLSSHDSMLPVHYDLGDLYFDSLEAEWFEADISVDTEGFYDVSNTLNTVSFNIESPSKYTVINEKLRDYLRRDVHTDILVVRLHSANECGAERAYGISVLINEMMKTMYPDMYKCIAVCPVTDTGASDSLSDQSKRILELYPALRGLNHTENTVEFAVIEDVEGGFGITENLCASNSWGIFNLLSLIAKLLHWAEDDSGKKLDYLKFGLKELPGFMDIPALSEMMKQFRRKISNVKNDAYTSGQRCSFCRAKKDANDLTEVGEGRLICKKCIESSVDTFEKLDTCAANVRNIILSSTEVDDTFDPPVKIDFVSTNDLRKRFADSETIPLSYTDISNRTVYVEYGLPESLLSAVIARQITLIWQMDNIGIDGSPVFEGHLDYIDVYVSGKLGHSIYAKNAAETFANKPGYIQICDELKKIRSEDVYKFMIDRFANKTDGDEDDGTEKIYRNSSGLTYYHYEKLDDSEKLLYEATVKAAEAFSKEPVTIGQKLTVNQIAKVYTAVLYDHPELFWISSYTVISGSVYGIGLHYCLNEREVKKRLAKIDRAATEIIKRIMPLMGDYKAVLTVHDAIASKIDYDSLKLDEEKLMPKFFRKHYVDDIRSIYGALVDHKAVCAGYASAMQYILNRLGFECTYVTGVCHGGGRHAWNLIKLEEEYYYIDTTWDDRSNTDPKKHRDGMHHDYFCVTTEEILKERSIEYTEDFRYPECVAVKCNYHVREKLYFRNYSYDKIKKAIQSRLQQGSKEIELKFADKASADFAYQKLINENAIGSILSESKQKGKLYYSSTNESLNIIKIRLK